MSPPLPAEDDARRSLERSTLELLQRVDSTRVQWVMGLHLSERNNSPEQVRAALKPALEHARYALHLASQDTPTPWFALD